MGVRYDRVVLQDRDTGEPLATVPISRGRTVYAAFEAAGRRLPTRCRGSAICGLCRLDIHEGRVDPPRRDPDEDALLDRVAPEEPTSRLACRIRPAEGEERLLVGIGRARWEAAEALRARQ